MKPTTLVPILDRLIDHHPNKMNESIQSQHQKLTALQVSICRDLENLFNTRRPELIWPIQWDRLNQSLINYGIPDMTGKILDNSAAQEKLCIDLSCAILYFEPRLKNIKVTFLSMEKDKDQILRLRIEALLTIDHFIEPIIFDSILDTGTNNFQIVESTDFG